MSAMGQIIMRDMSVRLALGSAAVFLFAAVALGAFGAHALKAKLEPDLLAVYQTAVQYHFWHALDCWRSASCSCTSRKAAR